MPAMNEKTVSTKTLYSGRIVQLDLVEVYGAVRMYVLYVVVLLKDVDKLLQLAEILLIRRAFNRRHLLYL